MTTNEFILALFAIIPLTIMSLSALITTVRNGRKIADLHVLVNSRMTELLELTRRASKAEGILIGKDEVES